MIVGYIRVSTREQSETDALEQQTARVEKAGASVIFTDIESGRSDKRKQFNKMLEMCKERKISEIIITRIDRLARSVITIHKTIVLLDEYGVKLTVLDAPIDDASSPFGWFSINQMAGLAEFESRLLSNRVKHGMEYFREQKKAPGRTPFGYRRVDEKYAPNTTLHESGKTYWEIAREIVDYFTDGKGSLRGTVTYFKEKYGVDWSNTGLKIWLLSPALQGHTAYFLVNSPNEPTQIHYNTHPALVSQSEVKIIQDKIQENRHAYSYGAKNKELQPLMGQVICGACGSKFYVRKARGKWGNYRARCRRRDAIGKHFCSNKDGICLPTIMTAVDNALIAKCKEIKAYTIEHIDMFEKVAPELVEPYEQLKTLRAMPKNAVIQQAIDQTLLEIQAIKQKNAVASQVSTEMQGILMHCFSDSKYWEALPWSDKRQVYRDLVDTVTVLDGEITEIKLLV
ncbi:resolvase domain-containing protein [Calothrix sp. NIES-4071]|nr:resolvase domain-containing protein [Calothrix sp. NIES-4071]BAZ57563.1 resolvase domain-containing protein [Calothrix sp. NIES-4105]